MQCFDSLLTQIIKICDKYGSRMVERDMEQLWIYAIKGLFGIQSQVYNLQALKEGSESEDSDREQERFEERMHFERFLLVRK